MNIITSVVNSYHVRDMVLPRETSNNEAAFKKVLETKKQVQKVSESKAVDNDKREAFKEAFFIMNQRSLPVASKIQESDK
jgi:hypothetical protein